MPASDFPLVLPTDRKARFELLLAGHWIDLRYSPADGTRGAANVRRARCGRCARTIPAGQGKPYAEFMRDGYRFTCRYLCPSCTTQCAAR